MKELLATGVTLAALIMPGNQPIHSVDESSGSRTDMSIESEGFLPRERITVPPVQSTVSDDMLPDFGSPAYL